MEVREEPRYSRDYLDPDKRSIANAVQIHFQDGTSTDRIEIEYPIGHGRRRAEGTPLLIEKARRNLATRLSAARADQIVQLCLDRWRLETTAVPDFMEQLLM